MDIQDYTPDTAAAPITARIAGRVFTGGGKNADNGASAMTAKTATAHDAERESWLRTMGVSISLLGHASARIEQADARIAELQKRIELLEQQATHDELTGILNRRGFFEAFTQELGRVERGYSGGGLLILIDLDNFKMINDTYGHQAGDAALRLVGKTLSGGSRSMDICARLGGDEFVLLLANTEREKALARAQNLIKQLNSLSLVWYGAEIPVRASLGLKDYRGGETPESIFGEADAHLYNEKRGSKALSSQRKVASAL